MHMTENGWLMEHNPRKSQPEENQIVAGNWTPRVKLTPQQPPWEPPPWPWGQSGQPGQEPYPQPPYSHYYRRGDELQPFKNGFIDLRDYEIVPEPIPQDESPRQFVQRMTGREYPDLTIDGQDLTWQELKDLGAMPIIERIIQIAYFPRIRLRK